MDFFGGFYMKRRKWESKAKFKIVMEGLRGRPVAEICNDYEIAQTQYYKWRDQFLSNGEKAFEVAQATSNEVRLQNQNQKLKAMVGELTMELKKSDELLS